LADSVEKFFWGDERNFLEPLMRLTRGHVRDHIVSSNIDCGPPGSAKKLRSSSEVQKSTFARFLGQNVGQITHLAVQPPREKYSALPLTQITGLSHAVTSPGGA
jgi:hypothetical protein